MKKCLIIHPEELTDNMIDTLISSGVQVVGLHPVGGTSSLESMKDLMKSVEQDEFRNKLQKLRENGISVEYQLHALSYLLPRELFSDHPDWFRIDENGKRNNDVNMCPSNKDALEQLSKNTAKVVEKLKSDTGRYYFWLDDVTGGGCECDECKKLTLSDQALLIYNAILKGIKQVDPNGKQCFLAYSKQFAPPEVIKPDKGIFVEFAPMRGNTNLPFATNPENEKFIKHIDQLLRFFGKEDSTVLDYWLDNSLFSNWTKPPKKLSINPKVISEDVEFYKSKGFEEITTFACYLSDDYRELHGEPPIAEYIKAFN